MTSLTINLKPLDQSQKSSMDHLKGDHFEEATENIFCFSLLRKVRPSRERPICPQQEIWGEPGLLALQAKGYHRFNWEEVTIDVPWLMAWPWYSITSIESHKTWGGAWTRIPYIVCACVDGVAWRSPISMWTGKKEMILLETSMYKHVMRAVCFGAPQPRWFAISPKRSINGRTWQAANVIGLGQAQYYNMI